MILVKICMQPHVTVLSQETGCDTIFRSHKTQKKIDSRFIDQQA